MRALVISGGGSKGAFAGGIAEFLINACGYKYNLFLGTSTGSLLVPLLSIGEIGKIKAIYTSVTQNQIFDVSPFYITEEDGVKHIKINHFNTVKMFIRGRKTFGESKALLKLIKKIMTRYDFERMRQGDADVYVTVSNLTTGDVEYKSLKQSTYDDFCEWIWASANMVPFMSLLEKNGCQYADGGFADLIPISEAIYRGATEIDIIVLKSSEPRQKKENVRNALELMSRTFDFMMNQIANDDIKIGKLEGGRRKVDLNFYYPPGILTESSLIFDPVEMKQWWKEGFAFAKEQNPVCKCVEVGV